MWIFGGDSVKNAIAIETRRPNPAWSWISKKRTPQATPSSASVLLRCRWKSSTSRQRHAPAQRGGSVTTNIPKPYAVSSVPAGYARQRPIGRASRFPRATNPETAPVRTSNTQTGVPAGARLPRRSRVGIPGGVVARTGSAVGDVGAREKGVLLGVDRPSPKEGAVNGPGQERAARGGVGRGPPARPSSPASRVRYPRLLRARAWESGDARARR